MSRLKRARLVFPDPNLAGEDGLLCVGGDLEPETLLSAYRIGVFPWPQEGAPLLWFYPAMRGLLRFDEVAWPRRFLRSVRQAERAGDGEITFNRAFEDVIRACARAKRKEQPGTWILPEMEEAYLRLHRLGYAHSAEAWRDGRLVGGAYGVFVDGAFSGESMFHLEADAGKRALKGLIERLQAHGVQWMDVQMVTPVVESIGGRLIAREEYAQVLASAQRAWRERGQGGGPFPKQKES